MFANAFRSLVVEDCEDVLATFGFLGGGDGVFEVIGYGVDGEAAGLFEEAEGGAGDCIVLDHNAPG